jgi:hypothetical protein
VIFEDDVGLLAEVSNITEAADLFREKVVSDDFVDFPALPA